MSRSFKFFFIFVGCFLFSAINPIFKNNVNAGKFLKVELNKELKKGNLLIGLKQHLGRENDGFSKNNALTFKINNGLLNLISSNGVKYKSKQIKITWKNVPLKNPYEIERLVFGPYASYESAQKKANSLKEQGVKAFVAFPDNWEVWVNSADNIPKDELEYKLFKKIYKAQITPFIEDENTSIKLQGPIYISAKEDIKINNTNFGKRFYLIQDSYGTWTLIQRINFDNYLEGVLPHEIGPNSPLEALKAQAVIARTWAIYNSKRFNIDQYHLCITTQCQVYKPPSFKNVKVQKAINDTSNLIMTYGNKPINSFYHGSNGGIAAGASESWEIINYPYLESSVDGSDALIKNFKLPLSNENALINFLDFDKKDFYGDNHHLFRWERKIPSTLINDKLITNKIISPQSNFEDISVSSRGFSGRAITVEIKIKDSNESILIEKDKIRRILNFLPSTLFTINKINDDLWLFKGGGFGHGVGLSQSGAIEMAELGFTYEQILNHYYPGTKIQKIEILSQ